jgi:iron complex outermembrane recepter protein
MSPSVRTTGYSEPIDHCQCGVRQCGFFAVRLGFGDSCSSHVSTGTPSESPSGYTVLKAVAMRVALISFCCFLSLSAHARADDAKHTVNIPAGDLPVALDLLAKQSGADLVYRPEQVRGFKTQGARGDFSAHDAVMLLLKGTPLELRTDPSGAMLIASPRAKATADNSLTPGSDEAKEGKKSSSGGFRVAQVAQGQTSGPSTVEKQEEQASKKKPVQLEEVVVTGSRIPTTAAPQAQPVLSYSREEIERSGQTTLTDFLNRLPDVSISSSEGVSSTFPGQTTIQLHGLPIGTTLILLNGRRVETNVSGFFDLGNIPTSAVDRIEILPVGASAVYGADALGGAVNVILRNGVNGFEANGKFGHAASLSDTNFNLGWGKSWERSSVSIIGSYQDRGELLGSERAVTSTTNSPAATPQAPYIQDACSPGNVYSLNGQNLPGLSSPEAGIPAGISGTPTQQQFAATAGKLNHCNAFLNSGFIPSTQREGALLSGHYQAGESLDFFTETLFTHENLRQTAGDFVAGFGGAFGATVIDAANPYNPFGQTVGVSFNDPNAIQNRAHVSERFLRPLVGIRGAVFSDWHYEATAYLSRDRLQVDQPNFDSTALQAALNSPNPATAFNPFTSGAPGTPQLLQSLLASPTHDVFVNKLVGGQGILRGPLVRLPAGSLQTVVGAEYSHESLLDNSNTPFSSINLDLHRNSYSVFTEARVPLLGGSAQVSREDRLALTLAGRYDHTSDFGGKATWQGGLLWRPSETLLFRGGYGVSYKAPLLQELGGPQSSFVDTFGFVGLVDPFRGGQTVIGETVSFGPNPNLKPETGDSTTFGVVYSSQALHGFEASLSYFNVHLANYIFAPAPQVLINNSSLFPGAVIRNPPTAQDLQQGFLGQITAVNDLYFNFGALRVKGFDADLRYAIDTALGQFIPSIALANIYRWDSAITPKSPSISYVSQATLLGPGFAPRWKGTAELAWRRDPLSAAVAGRYVGRYKDYQDVVPNSNELGNFWIIDLNGRYDVGKDLFAGNSWLAGAYAAVGAVNLFDRVPQLTYNLPYDPAESDIRGRFVYAQLGVRW